MSSPVGAHEYATEASARPDGEAARLVELARIKLLLESTRRRKGGGP